jgi:hypothetical protein
MVMNGFCPSAVANASSGWPRKAPLPTEVKHNRQPLQLTARIPARITAIEDSTLGATGAAASRAVPLIWTATSAINSPAVVGVAQIEILRGLLALDCATAYT